MPKSPATRAEARYLELRLRRPASAWPLLRLVSVGAAIALCVTLLRSPDTGLFLFWDLLVPVLPLLFLVAPGLWRNICPMAATNQVPRVLGITRALTLPRWLDRHGYAIGAVAFFAIVASRGTVFEANGTASAILIASVLVLALVGGLAFKGKSGFCGSVCPLRGVQGLYGQAPVVAVQNSHCRPCVGCTSNCPDLKPKTHFADGLRADDGEGGGYRRLLVGTLPGFVVAFYVSPDLAVWGPMAALASMGSFFLLESLLRTPAERLAALYAGASFGAFYWFNVPVLADGIARIAGGAPPEWAIWEGRAVAIGLALAWFARGRRAGVAAPVSTPRPLPMISAVRPAEPAAVAEAPDAPAAPEQPVAGDPPVTVPDRRSKRRRMSAPQVTVMPEGRRFDVTPGTTLLEVAQQAGVEVQAGCRMGLCGCDPVRILSGDESLSPAGEEELATISRLGFKDPTRMACCTRVLGDAVVSLEPLLAAGGTAREPAAAAKGAAANGNGKRPARRPAKSFTATESVARVVIVGNGIAGVTAADHIRRHHAGCDIDLVSDERHPFYNRTGISRLISSSVGIHKMYLLPDSWYEERRISSWLNTRVSRIDRDARRVVLGTGDVLPYDRLILATGSSPFVPPVEGFGLKGSFCLRGADDAMMIRAFVQQEGARNAVVAGGGVLGLEAADELRKLGLEVVVVEREPWLAPAQVDARGGDILREHIQRRGIEVLLETTLESMSGTERVTKVKLSDHSTREADLLLVCAGISPNTALAEEAGLEVAKGVLVDDQMRTSDPLIFAAGDVAEHAGRIYGVWPAAVEQAEVAAINALGAQSAYEGSTVPTRLKVAGVDLTSIGRPHSDLEGDVEVALEDQEAGRYRKLVLADGRIAGAVLLGHAEDSAAVLAASRERRDVRGHVDALKAGDWEVLNESHFEQAVAASMTRHRSNGNGNGHAPSRAERARQSAA